jgi:flagellar basal-body rod protein FlgG
VGQIALANVPSPGGLLAVGNSTYVATPASGAATPLRGGVIQQKAIEESNVDAATAMTNLLDAQQTYSLSSRAIQTQDQMLQIANQITSA